jgi:serine/threonine protein kinase
MPLSAGQRLGPYEILAPIGSGGMGEVYRARDPRLDREVAIKVSVEQFSERFEREARAIGALNHPNICAIYDVGPNYLVMELIEGESPQGPMPLETALRYARQIASALAAAHERGIVHRDLKPANIKITPAGSVKVLDFGLAKMTALAASSDAVGVSPTLTMGSTQSGTLLGTAGYMSPEQAKGKPVDQRADIWAFGVVLYEMIVGGKLFEGETISDTLAGVIRAEPRWDAVPFEVRRLLKSCLEKDPKLRLRDIADSHLLLESAPVPGVPPWRSPLLWICGAAIVLLAAIAAWGWVRPRPPATLVVSRWTMPVGAYAFGRGGIAVSRDGTRLAFSASLAGSPIFVSAV